jgi:hypothetical protein
MSDVRNMTNLYYADHTFPGRYVPGAETFNDDISGWNTANVVSMSNAFYFAAAFNADISTWDVGRVNSMNHMFFHASAFNQPVGSWEVSNVLDFWSMFASAVSFNQDLSGWKVGRAQLMTGMFSSASAFDQQLCWGISANCNTRNMLTYSNGACVDYSCCPECGTDTHLNPSTNFPPKC